MSNILMVDDSKTSRKILRGILEENGHVIVGEAVNGAEAIEMYKALHPSRYYNHGYHYACYGRLDRIKRDYGV